MNPVKRTCSQAIRLDKCGPQEPGQDTQRPCNHLNTEIIGFNRGAKFSQCRACGHVLVAESGRVWIIPPVRKAS